MKQHLVLVLCLSSLAFATSYITKIEPREDLCSSCQDLVQNLINIRVSGATVEELYVEFEKLCQFLGLNALQCQGKVLKGVDIFAYTVEENPKITSERYCYLILQGTMECDKGSNYEWTIDIPEGQPGQRRKFGNASFNILHISDFHYEPLYTANKTNTCSNMCCLSNQNDGNLTDGTACGYWGEYAYTDMPLHTIEEVLKQASTHKFDYVYLTGDFVNHRGWDASEINNTAVIKKLFEKIRETFKEVPLYAIIGNHEPSPIDCYSSANVTDTSVSSKWLYDLLREEWSTWLPEGTVQEGGYYTVSPKQGFRIIVLNNNVALSENWWLAHDDYDPYGQLRWLVDVLKTAEDEGEVVHVLQHVPTGHSLLLDVWVREYNRIVERFSDTIGAQFNGHTHQDEFLVYYDTVNDSKAINVALNGGSVISDRANPNYKIYEVDDGSYSILNSETWTFNLTLANENPHEPLQWFKLYSFKDTHSVDNLEPEELSALTNRMASNRHLIKQFHALRHRYGGKEYEEGCDETCQKNALCSMVVSRHGDKTQCERLLEIYHKKSMVN